MPEMPRKLLIFRIFAARAAAELARLRAERGLIESEERFRDLFEEAPIAYVQEDLDSRFVRANRAAIRILGLKPEEVVGTLGMSLVAETPENKRTHRTGVRIGRPGDRHQQASCSSFDARTTASRCGCSGGRSRSQTASTRGPCSSTSPIACSGGAGRNRRLQGQNLYLQEEIQAVHDFEEIIGAEPAILSAPAGKRRLRVAPTDARC